jgi:putative methionine-R-sulfoxide reductase with GAF domain
MSEIVIPVFENSLSEIVTAVLDIDSATAFRFGEKEKKLFEEVVSLIYL